MADRMIGLRIMLEYGHFIQVAPINEADAKALMEKCVTVQHVKDEVVTGHSFTEDGQPWTYSFRAGRVVGMHTFALEQKQTQSFQPNLPRGGYPHQFGRS